MKLLGEAMAFAISARQKSISNEFIAGRIRIKKKKRETKHLICKGSTSDKEHKFTNKYFHKNLSTF